MITNDPRGWGNKGNTWNHNEEPFIYHQNQCYKAAAIRESFIGFNFSDLPLASIYYNKNRKKEREKDISPFIAIIIVEKGSVYCV